MGRLGRSFLGAEGGYTSLPQRHVSVWSHESSKPGTHGEASKGRTSSLLAGYSATRLRLPGV